MIHVYTYGRNSMQCLIMSDKDAKATNDFTDIFSKAQRTFKEATGRDWTPSDPLAFEMTAEEERAFNRYNKMVPRINVQHKIRNAIFTLLRVDVSGEELDDYLIKRI